MASADAGVSAASTEQKAWFDYYVRQGESTERVLSKFQAWYGYSVAIACWTQSVSGLGCAESEGGDTAGMVVGSFRKAPDFIISESETIFSLTLSL